jgi:hypothetical protein
MQAGETARVDTSCEQATQQLPISDSDQTHQREQLETGKSDQKRIDTVLTENKENHTRAERNKVLPAN